jgi:hypothetical protein
MNTDDKKGPSQGAGRPLNGQPEDGRPGRPQPAARRRPSRRSRGLWIGLSAVAALVAIGIALLVLWPRFRSGQGMEDRLEPVEALLEGGAGERVVVLVFPNRDGTGSVNEERLLPSRNRLEEDLMAVMGALCDGPTGAEAVASLPPGTRPLAAFYNESEGSVVLDFSRELVTNHAGGSAAERATLATILGTIALNFPEVQTCTLLVDGAETETLAGHLTMDQPFVPRRWL